ncbi:MAG: FAD-dependent oxidoreductase, partial [Chloroflexi bacterium]|nr:FAD-dependent oxidoreductase [Chloroflexota bacterium]
MISIPLTTDALVIGSGLAGGIAALGLAQRGLEVALITRAEDPGETNTSLAQGGIVYEGEDDSLALLAADSLRAGAGLSLPEAAEVLAAEGPPLVRRLLIERLGVPFVKLPTDGYDLTVEGAHSVKRILHVADATGRAIEERIIAAA